MMMRTGPLRRFVGVGRIHYGHGKRLCHHHVFDASPAAPFEVPTPVVMLGGEGLGTGVWMPLIRRFSSQGYSGVAVPFPEGIKSSEEGVSFLRDVIDKHGMPPPLLLAHSLASHIAVQYLESHPLAGVIMVNPVPLNPAAMRKAATVLSTKYSDCSVTHYQAEHGVAGSSVLCRYYGVTSGPSVSVPLDEGAVGFPTAFLRHLSSSPPPVLLEACSVPALVVMTAGDDALFDSKQEQEVLNLFGIHTEVREGGEEDEDGEERGVGVGVDVTATGREEAGASSFLRLRYNLSRVAHTSDLTADKCLSWAETYL